MNVEKIPLVGAIKKSLNAIVINLILLSLVCLGLGLTVFFYPDILRVLVTALLLISSAVLLALAVHFWRLKHRYFAWLEK